MAVLFRREPPTVPTTARRPATGPKPPEAAPAARSGPSIEQIVKQRLVTVEFQPIVRLDSGEVIGFESLARGPADGALAVPNAMFKAAVDAGMIAELDVVAHAAVYRALKHASLDESVPIFINSHPLGLLATAGNEGNGEFPTPPDKLQIAVEISERQLVSDPIGTLTAIAYARSRGIRVALDNVGGMLESLALIPFAQPDVIKLDPMLVNDAQLRAAQVVSSLVSYTEHNAALVVAQGIEREEQVRAAFNTGATLGQGYYFSYPTTVPVAERPGEPLNLDVHHQESEPDLRPSELLGRSRTPTRVDGVMLQNLAKLLEDNAEAADRPFVLLQTIPAGTNITEARLNRLRELGRSASLLLVLAADESLAAARDLRIDPLRQDDPLRGEMVIAVLSPTMSSLLVATPAEGDTTGTMYDCLLTHDRAPVLRASRAMLDRVTAPPTGAAQPID